VPRWRSAYAFERSLIWPPETDFQTPQPAENRRLRPAALEAAFDPLDGYRAEERRRRDRQTDIMLVVLTLNHRCDRKREIIADYFRLRSHIAKILVQVSSAAGRLDGAPPGSRSPVGAGEDFELVFGVELVESLFQFRRGCAPGRL
jgi:hypothetical protein